MAQDGILEKQLISAKQKETPDLFNVIMWNDDVTPMDVVVEVLTTVFDHDPLSAIEIMLTIHTSDKGIVGTYFIEDAYRRVENAERICEKFNAPLLITVELAE